MAAIVVLLVLLQRAALAVAQLPFPRLPGQLSGQRQPLKVTATIPLFDSYCYRDISRIGASGLCDISATPLGNVSETLTNLAFPTLTAD